MYLARLATGCQLNDCDATSRYTDRVGAAAAGLSKWKGLSFAAHPAVSKDQLCQSVRTFSFRDEPALVAVVGWSFVLRVKSEAAPMRRKVPTGDMPEMGRGSSHSVPGMVGGSLALKLRRRKHVASGDIPRRSWCCGIMTHRAKVCIYSSSYSSLSGLACLSGTSGRWGGDISLLPVAQPHLVSEIKGIQSQSARRCQTRGAPLQTWSGPSSNVSWWNLRSAPPFWSVLRACCEVLSGSQRE